MAAYRFILAVTAALLVAVSDAAPKCTEDESSAFIKAGLARPLKCQVQLDKFDVCDDDCLRAAQGLVAVAPNCSYANQKTAYEDAMASLNACKDWRAGVNTEFRYMPTNGTGLTKCDHMQLSDWTGTYTRLDSPASKCALASYTSTPCTDACLKLIEESVTMAPACPRSDLDYPYGEHQKQWLVGCLKSRGESAASNAVLYSVRNGDGSFTRVTPPTTAPVTARVTLPTPTKAQSNSAVQRGLSILTAVAASIAFYAAV